MRFSQGIRQNLPVLEYEEAISAYLAWTAEQGSVGILPAALGVETSPAESDYPRTSLLSMPTHPLRVPGKRTGETPIPP
jgi:hypothetical protein